MKHPILITVLNDTVGLPAQADGVMGLFCKAVAVSGTFALDTAYLLTSKADLTALGINAAYDTTNGVAVFQQVSEFYDQAGDGAYCWLFGVDKSTPYATYIASDTYKSLIRSTASADPLNRVKMLGICYEVPTATQSAADFPSDVTAAITAFKASQQTLFAEGYQFSGILDGYKMSTSVNPSTIGTMANKSAFPVSLCITGLKPNGVSAVGHALGRFARISVGHGFGAVEDGPTVATEAYLTNCISVSTSGTLIVGRVYTVYGASVTYNGNEYTVGKSFTAVSGHTSFTSAGGGICVENMVRVQDLTPTYIDALGTKQFMFLRTWAPIKSGFYWNDGATCEDPTKQLSTQEYNRVANRLSADALSFFVNEIGKNLPLDTKTGAIDQAYLNLKQAEFKETYINPLNELEGTGDLTDATLLLSGPNFNSTKRMNFTLNIVPTPILGSVEGTIQFTSTI